MKIDELIMQAEKDCRDIFDGLDKIEETNTLRVLDAFQEEQVGARHFSPTTGYGYDDIGRDTLERIFARVFRCEQAIVRPHIVSGTHALSLCLFGLLLPGDHLISATGLPYDTMQEVIGLTSKDGVGTLKEMNVSFSPIDMTEDGKIDINAVLKEIESNKNTKVVMFQRSRGYAWRPSLLPEDFADAIRVLHEKHPDIFIMVDNCYGEFVRETEPSFYGADVCVGSLIKNAGGAIAPTGGYIVGTQKAIHRIEARLTAPGIGREEGSYAASYRPFYQGLFTAPHTVMQAVKTAVLSARVFELLGMVSTPAYNAVRADIIQAIQLGSEEAMVAFCRGIQAASPVDSDAAPEPWDMPGYENKVVMAAGTFVGGASIEISADGPIRPPYAVYQQGAVTYTHGKIAIKKALEELFSSGAMKEQN